MSPAGPRFSLVSVVGDDAAVLPDFIASVEAQTFGLDRVQVVLVDIDAPDEVAAMLRSWADARPDSVTLLNAPEDGPVAALNAGLAAARGTWVGFPDVRDVLAPKYLAVVDRFLDRNPSTALVATNRLHWDPATGEVSRAHPLRALFGGNNLVDLTSSTWHFHDSATAAFFPTEPVHDAGLEFDVAVPAGFAGGHFLARYLIEVGHPAVGFLRRARYHQRRPAEGPGHRPFAEARALFDHGYTDLVRRAREHLGEVPAWLQRLLAFELTRYLDRAAGAPATELAANDDVDAFHRRIAGLIKAGDLVEPIERAQFPVTRETRLALIHGYRPESWVDDHVLVDKVDAAGGLVRARYYFTGVAPPEQVVNGGVRSAPVHAKTRTLTYLGRAPLCERILWVRPAPDLAISISGEPADLRFQRPAFAVTTVAPAALDWHLGALPGRVAADVARYYLPVARTPEGREAQKAIERPAAQRDYEDAWVFTDEVRSGGDNAEFLFEHVRAHHPGINAFFVVDEGTQTWQRLHKAHGKRVVAYGGHRWRVLMAYCTQLLSSHSAAAVPDPRLTDFMRPRWRFTHLGHGVRAHDAARLLAGLPVELLIATTTPEYDSLVGDGNDHPFTSHEVRLTGMPRLDRLVGYDRQIPPGERDLVLLAPAGLGTGWLELLEDPALRDLCAVHGKTLTLLVPPGPEDRLDRVTLPDHATVVTTEDDLQAVVARSHVLATDDATYDVDAAYVGRPVVYLRAGGARRGSSEDSTAFGPVTHSVAAAVTAIGAALRSGHAPAAPYDARIAEAFPFTDDGCCERVIDAVRRGSDAPRADRASRHAANQEE